MSHTTDPMSAMLDMMQRMTGRTPNEREVEAAKVFLGELTFEAIVEIKGRTFCVQLDVVNEDTVNEALEVAIMQQDDETASGYFTVLSKRVPL